MDQWVMPGDFTAISMLVGNLAASRKQNISIVPGFAHTNKG
jgi:hypothetical protein